jgi:dTDP-4-amino-4,6-dideoxygalactose transaminase
MQLFFYKRQSVGKIANGAVASFAKIKNLPTQESSDLIDADAGYWY